MKIYLVFGECDGFGNDCFLSAIALTEEKAKEEIKDTYFMGQKWIDIYEEEYREALLKVEAIDPVNLIDIREGGIYAIDIDEMVQEMVGDAWCKGYVDGGGK